MDKGTNQGDSLSPLLFIIFMDQIIKHCKRRTKKYKVGNSKMRPVHLQALVYADDILLISNNTRNLQQAIIEWVSTLEERGMKINTSKSKVMKVGREENGNEDINIKWKDDKLEQVNTYQYLGTIISSTGSLEDEINNRVNKANGIYYQIYNSIIGKKEISTKVKIQVYKTVYIPTLLYGSETWVMLDKHKSRITSSEMKYLRKIKGKTRRDRVRNISIGESSKMLQDV